MDLFEAMETARSMRQIGPREVPDDLVERLIRAATWAPSPGNSQGWDFVVVRDQAVKERLAEAVGLVLPELRQALDPRPDAATRRMHAAADRLIQSLPDVPVLIFVCGQAVYPPAAPMEEFIWSALYPAVQNLLLAARGLGLAAPLTTVHMTAEPLVRELLALPDEVKIAATIPVGWPARPFGPVRRRPLAEVVHSEKWGRRM